MIEIEKYLKEALDFDSVISTLPADRQNSLPLYLKGSYQLSEIQLLGYSMLLAKPNDWQFWKLDQLENNLNTLGRTFQKKIILMLPEITTINRKRLINRRINFIVPGKQLFLPELLIDLQERFFKPKSHSKTRHLLPSAQFLLLYHIIHRHDVWQLEKHSLKDIANKTGYSAVAIRSAVDDLIYHELILLTGTKEKYIQFSDDRHDLWRKADGENLLTTPVLKTVYIDKKPEKPFMLLSNASAMPEYTDLNPSKKPFYALDKDTFYNIEKENGWHSLNSVDGTFCLEIWKYNPLKLAGEMLNDSPVVDPLSLYLSLKNTRDERLEMGLEQILEKFIW